MNLRNHSKTAAVLVTAAMFYFVPISRAASTLDFSGSGTLSPLLSGSDPLGLNGQPFSFAGFIDESATPTTCPTGIPIAATVCYTVPANQFTGKIGQQPLITITTPSTLALVIPASGPETLEVQFNVLSYVVTAVLELAPGSFAPGEMKHPGPFNPSTQTVAAATSVPPPVNGSSVQYCETSCSTGSVTWLGLAGTVSSVAPKVTTLTKFTGANGSGPYGGVVFDKNGALYGTTESGGTSNLGAVFQLAPPTTGNTWTANMIHSFSGTDGEYPYGGLTYVLFGSNGVFYGTAQSGGTGHGVVFQLSPPSGTGGAWTQTVLHTFSGASDGANPHAGLAYVNGSLYGTTQSGGTSNMGVVFELSPPKTKGAPWTETVLHNFSGGNDGNDPQGAVVLDASGAVYGTTAKGGTSSDGIAYQLVPPPTGSTTWTENILHTFAGRDGSTPTGALVFDSHGNLYGTTSKGGPNQKGTVFLLTPSTGSTWTQTVLYSFIGVDGASPGGTLVFDSHGNIDGVTGSGGLSNHGTIFQLAPTSSEAVWLEAVLHSFGSTDGSNPQGSIVFDKNGNLYGITVGGGTGSHGTVFMSTP